jgi:hypothetical protein
MRKWSERAYYRLVYPIRARPELRIEEAVFSVLDLSERGVRFIGSTVIEIGTRFVGVLRLETSGELEIEGEIVWARPPEIGAQLNRGVSFGVMLDEQRRLNVRFTGRK